MPARPATLLYVLACLVAPVAWGLLVVWVSNIVEARLRRDGREEPPTIEYHI